MIQSPDADSAPPRVGQWLRAHALVLFVSLVVMAGFAWLLKAGALPVLPPAAALSVVRPWTAVGFVAAFLAVHVVRCSRWSLLVPEQRRPSLGLTIAICFIGYGAQVLLPFRLGEAVRPALIHRHTRLPLGTAAGISGAERIVDGLVLSVLLMVSLLFGRRVSPLPDHIGALPIPAALIPGLAWGGVIGFGLLSISMVGVYVYQAPLQRWLARHLARVSPKLSSWAERTMASVVGGFAFLRERHTTLRFVILTLLYWALSVVSFWFLLWGAGLPSPTLVEAGVVLGVLGLGMAVPNAPGYFGTFQMSGYAALVLFFPIQVVTNEGAAFLFLLYVSQIGLTLVTAAVALSWGLKRSLKGTLEGTPEGTLESTSKRASGASSAPLETVPTLPKGVGPGP